MWGVVWLGWMVVVAFVLTLHHVPWWTYLVVSGSLVLTTYIGWAALGATNVIGLVSVSGMVGAAALLYFYHAACWLYLVAGSACWVGVSIGCVAAAQHPRAFKMNSTLANEPQGGEATRAQ
ncbi:MAG TPA: hypothetical protein VEP50_06860 [bacterium]|nr:hypothetical protein [bacterium]